MLYDPYYAENDYFSIFVLVVICVTVWWVTCDVVLFVPEMTNFHFLVALSID